MSDELYERIRQRLAALKMSDTAASKAVVGNGSLLRNLKRGRSHSLKGPQLIKLAALLGVTPDWLLHGEDQHMRSEDVAAGLVHTLPDFPGKSALKPYEGTFPNAVPEVDARAGAGNGSVGEHSVVAIRRGESYVGHKVISEWAFPPSYLRHELHMQPGEILVLEVVGDSMSPTVEPGDRLIIDTTHSTPTPDGVYVIDEGDGPLVKRLQLVRRSSPAEIMIISDNPHHKPYTLPISDVRIIGRVSGRVSRM